MSFLATDHPQYARRTDQTPPSTILCYRWAIIAVGGILFGYAFIRILFPDVTAGHKWDGNFLFGLPAIAAMLAVVLALWGLFYLIDHLAEKNLNKTLLA